MEEIYLYLREFNINCILQEAWENERGINNDSIWLKDKQFNSNLLLESDPPHWSTSDKKRPVAILQNIEYPEGYHVFMNWTAEITIKTDIVGWQYNTNFQLSNWNSNIQDNSFVRHCRWLRLVIDSTKLQLVKSKMVDFTRNLHHIRSISPAIIEYVFQNHDYHIQMILESERSLNGEYSSDYLLPTDPPRWSSGSGDYAHINPKLLSIDQLREVVGIIYNGGDGWDILHDFIYQISFDTDSEGWQYNTHFNKLDGWCNHFYSSSTSMNVRRRLWFRTCVPDHKMSESQDLFVSYTSIHQRGVIKTGNLKRQGSFKFLWYDAYVTLTDYQLEVILLKYDTSFSTQISPRSSFENIREKDSDILNDIDDEVDGNSKSQTDEWYLGKKLGLKEPLKKKFLSRSRAKSQQQQQQQNNNNNNNNQHRRSDSDNNNSNNHNNHDNNDINENNNNNNNNNNNHPPAPRQFRFLGGGVKKYSLQGCEVIELSKPKDDYHDERLIDSLSTNSNSNSNSNSNNNSNNTHHNEKREYQFALRTGKNWNQYAFSGIHPEEPDSICRYTSPEDYRIICIFSASNRQEYNEWICILRNQLALINLHFWSFPSSPPVLDRVIIEGFLWVRGELLPFWKYRKFELRQDGVLVYYKDNKVIGKIRLRSCYIDDLTFEQQEQYHFPTEITCGPSFLKSDSTNEFIFVIRNEFEGFEILLKTSDLSTKNLWMKALQNHSNADRIIESEVNKHYSTSSGMIRKIFSGNEGISTLEELSEEFKSKPTFERTSSLWQVSENRDSIDDSVNLEGRRSTFYSFE